MRMLPRLQAEDRLNDMDGVQFGIAAAFDPDSMQPIRRRLHERAEGVEAARRPIKATPAQLGAIGIGMRGDVAAAPAKAGNDV